MLERIRRFLVDLVGRKHLRCKANIPAPLEGDFDLWPDGDPELALLAQYEPHLIRATAAKPATYSATVEAMVRNPPPATSIVNIDQMQAILSLPAPRHDELFAAILGRKAHYPVPPPVRPDEPQHPPNWTPHHRAFPLPSFAPPYYDRPRWLSRLNRFVDEAHAAEHCRVTRALARKAQMEAQLEQRNEQVAALARNAFERWEATKAAQAASFRQVQAEYRKQRDAYLRALRDEQGFARWQLAAAKTGVLGLLCRIDLTLRTANLPPFLSREGGTSFQDTSGILIHEHRFPDVQKLRWVKNVKLKDNRATRPATYQERKEAAAILWPYLCLRLASQIAHLDTENIVKAIALNGWTDRIDPTTGQGRRVYCATLFATKDQIAALDPAAWDLVAFQTLNGAAAPPDPQLTPITPVVRLDATAFDIHGNEYGGGPAEPPWSSVID